MRSIIFFFCLLPLALSAQNFNGFHKTSKDSIMIKWLPNNFAQFELMLQGTTIYKREINGNEDPAMLEFNGYPLAIIPPVKERYDALREEVEVEDRMKALLQPFYERSLDKTQENFAFGTAVIENIVNSKFQYFVQNIFIDKDIHRSKNYAYKVVFKDASSLIIIVKPSVKNKDNEIADFSVSLDQKKVVELLWNSATLKKEVFGYNILHAISDTLNATNLLTDPYLPFNSDSEKKSDVQTVRHNESEMGKFHFYKLQGLDVFASPAYFSSWKEIYVPKLIKDWTQIDSIKAKGTTRTVHASITIESKKTLIQNVALWRSAAKDTGYELMLQITFKDTLPTFHIEGKESGDHFYYKIAISNEDDTVFSLPYYFFSLDQHPPGAPTEVTGTIDSLGIVSLNWTAPNDDDIRGYKVYRANSKQEEFVEITQVLDINPRFSDTIRLDNLSSKIYYFVSAVDLNYNNSISSDTIRLLKPDTIPPVAANLYQVDILKEGLKIQWVNSDSDDLLENYLVRKSLSGVDTIFTWNDSTTNFVDTVMTFGAEYIYTIFSKDMNNNQTPSLIFTKIFEPGYRNPLQEVVASPKQSNKLVELTWAKPTEPVFSYVIYRAKGDEKLLPLKTITDPNQLTFQDQRVYINTKYTYSIKYVNEKGIHSIPVILEIIYQ